MATATPKFLIAYEEDGQTLQREATADEAAEISAIQKTEQKNYAAYEEAKDAIAKAKSDLYAKLGLTPDEAALLIK